MIKPNLLLVLFFLTTSFVYAQSDTTIGALPQLIISVKLPKNLKLVNKFESRQVFFEKIGTDKIQYNYKYKLTDISTLIDLKTTTNQSIALGYRARISDKKYINQIIQRFSFVQKFDASKIGHRFSSDQTFNSDSFVLRIRYRFTYEKSLNVNKIDTKEFYLKANNEYLTKFEDNKTSLEIRITPILGYKMDKKNKIELGLDYRVSNFITSNTKNRLWLILGWYFNIN